MSSLGSADPGLASLERVFSRTGLNSAFNLNILSSASMIFTTLPVPTPIFGTDSTEAFVFNYNFDTDAPKIFAETPAYPMSVMGFMAANSTDPFA